MLDTGSVLEQCRWPTLATHYNRALREAVGYILGAYDVSGIVVAGSIINGNPHAFSDLDICVVHTKSQRQRVQKRFNGVPAEIFVNPPVSFRRYFVEERDRPCTATMLATGFVTLNRDPVVDELRAEARDWLQRPPDLSDNQLTWLRYAAADTYENAQDIKTIDPANACQLLNVAVDHMLRYWFVASNRYLPRDKEFLAVLEALDTKLGELARSYYLAHEPSHRFAYAERIANCTIHETGFFEWESQLEEVEQ